MTKKSLNIILLATILVGSIFALPSLAAQRLVLAEDFSNTS